MKIAVLGDTHFGARNDSPIFNEHFKRFYDEVFFPYLEKNNIEYVIQLGDVFDRRKYVNFNTLKSVKTYFFDRLNYNYKSIVLVGNHDTFYKNTNNVNSLSLLLEKYNNITPIVYPETLVIDGIPILFIPWICPENEKMCFEAMQNTEAQICVGHFEIQGFEMYKGTVIDHGLDKNIFNKFDLVLSGHYHHKSTKGNITYCGTPYEMTWSDYGDDKGFHILDTETRELTFVHNPFNMFVKHHYDDLDKTMEDVLLDDFSYYKNTIVKVVVRNKTNPFWFDTLIDKLEKAGAVDIQVVDDHFHSDIEDDSDIVNEAEDTLTILNKYIHQMQIQTDKKKLEVLMRSLYNEALTNE
jgi:DNA repair exonuclease SbcCD nuclease subunit